MSDIKFRRLKSGKVYATVEIPPCEDCGQCPLRWGCVIKEQRWFHAMCWDLGERHWITVDVPGAGCPWGEEEEA